MDDLESLPFTSVRDVVSYGDFVATFIVLSEERGAPSSEHRLVDRRLTLRLDDVLWESGRVDVPARLELQDSGWIEVDGVELRAVPDTELWLDVGEVYLGAFVLFEHDEYGFLSLRAVYGLDAVGRASTPELGVVFAGMTPAQIASELALMQPDPLAAARADLAPVARFDEVSRIRDAGLASSVPSREDGSVASTSAP